MQNADYDPIIKWQVFALLPGDNVTATESNVMIIIIDPTGVPCAQTQLLSKCFFSMQFKQVRESIVFIQSDLDFGMHIEKNKVQKCSEYGLKAGARIT